MKKKVLILVVAIVLLLAGGVSLYDILGDTAAPQTMETGDAGVVEGAESAGGGSSSDGAAAEKAPDFKIYDEEGQLLTLADLKGKPAVINFWASWCGACKSHMADFNEQYLNVGDSVQFVMINVTDGSRETQESAMEVIDSEGYKFPVYFDLELTASKNYEVNAIPLTYFLDDEGNVVAKATGALDAETLQKGIKMITE